MNKELTPMMELIEDLKENSKSYYEQNEVYLSKLLEQEKQVIEDAVTDTLKNLYVDGNISGSLKLLGETYYNTKYNNQIK